MTPGRSLEMIRQSLIGSDICKGLDGANRFDRAVAVIITAAGRAWMNCIDWASCCPNWRITNGVPRQRGAGARHRRPHQYSYTAVHE